MVLIMTCCTCGSEPCINPNFCRLCRDADRRLAKNRIRHSTTWSPPAELEDEPPAEKAALSGDWAQGAWNASSWSKAARQYRRARAGHVLIAETNSEDLNRLRRLMSNEVSLDRAWFEIDRAVRERYNQAPEATFNACVYELRTYGLPQLSKPNCQRRLCDLSTAQLKNLIVGLQQRRGQYPNVTDELLTTLATICDARGISNEQ
jgi:hypothetical protein